MIKTRFIFTLVLTTTFFLTFAQPAAITVFSDEEPLTLSIDGRQINEKPKNSVTAWDITGEGVRIYVTLPGQDDQKLKQNIMVRPGKEMKVMVKQKRNGKWVLRYRGQGPLPEKPVAKKQPAKAKSSTSKNTNEVATEEVSINTNTGTTSQGVSISTSTSVTDDSGRESVNVNTEVNESGVNMTVTETTTQTTTTVTSTTSSGTGEVDPPADPGEPDCMPMGSTDFQDACNSISSKTFEDSKITQARQIIKNNCLRAGQIKKIMTLMEYEDSRLTIAKFAYEHCFNPKKYYKVNDAFEYESSIEELNTYMESQ